MPMPFNATMAGSSGGDFQSFGQVYLLIILLVVILQMRQRRVKIWTLAIMPVFLLLVTVPMVSPELNTGWLNLAAIGAGLVLGFGIGLLIGSMMQVKVDTDGTMVLKGSLLVVLLWGGVIAAKLFGKGLLGDTGLFSFDLLTSAFLMMTLGTMIGRRALIVWKYAQMRKQPLP